MKGGNEIKMLDINIISKQVWSRSFNNYKNKKKNPQVLFLVLRSNICYERCENSVCAKQTFLESWAVYSLVSTYRLSLICLFVLCFAAYNYHPHSIVLAGAENETSTSISSRLFYFLYTFLWLLRGEEYVRGCNHPH